MAEKVLLESYEKNLNSTEDTTCQNISKEIKWYTIDKDMITAKLAYLFLGAERSSVLPYIAVFLTSVGLTIEDTGTVLSLSYVGIMVGSLFWGIMADKTRSYKTILVVLFVSYGAINLAIPLISAKVGWKKLNKCPLETNKTYNSTLPEEPLGHVSSTQLTLIMSLLFFSSSFFGGSIFTMVDAAVIQKCKISKRKANFSKQLLFIAIGFGSAATISGKVLEIFPKAKVSCYFAVYVVSAVFLFCGCISSLYMYKGVQMPPKQVKENIRKDLWKILKKIDVIFFLSTVLINGIMYSIYLNYFFLFLKQLNSANIIIGLTVATGSFSGIIALFFTSWIIKVLYGTFHTMLFSTVLMSCRFLAFTYLRNSLLVIPLQLILHGCSMSLFLSVKTEHLKIISPKNILSTMLGMTSSIFFGISMIVGSKIGGSLYETYGARTLFLCTSAFGFLWSIILGTFLISNKYRAKKKLATATLCK
ncbi:major facilitator superfamily domain-containing protein 6 isoform X2 [Hydra vulgaris]|uniref:Major facilitator superfamily domain-containing protein 6 isoform X2 n=1 Tax=Hydra vulgaris TaxID=6087 RepID=A0ABM4BP92_HYDVU